MVCAPCPCPTHADSPAQVLDLSDCPAAYEPLPPSCYPREELSHAFQVWRMDTGAATAANSGDPHGQD